MKEIFRNKLFYLLWGASIFGAVAVLPYATTLGGVPLSLNVVISALVQAALLYGIVTFLGCYLSKRAGFVIVPTSSYFLISVCMGIAVGVCLRLLDHFIFVPYSLVMQKSIYIPMWQRLLATFYGAINEEMLLRLFAVSFLTLLLTRIPRISQSFASVFSIIFCAVLFGLGHLPTLYKLAVVPSFLDIARVMMLNGFAGIVFGLLYYRYGLFSSILCHFIADLLVHVFR